MDQSEPEEDVLRGIWSEVCEVLVDESPEHLPSLTDGFEKNSQDWFTAVTTAFVSISKKDRGMFPDTAHLLAVPAQLQQYANQIRCGNGGFTLHELLKGMAEEATAGDVSRPFDTTTPCKMRNGPATLGQICGLLSNFFSGMVERILESDGPSPANVNHDHYKYVCMMIAFCNSLAEKLNGTVGVLPQYWPASHGKRILKTIKIEFQCGDSRKMGSKQTQQQHQTGQLRGRKRRTTIYAGYIDEPW